MMTDKNVSWGREASCILSLCNALAGGDGFLERDLDGRGDEHYCDDLDEITGQEGDDAGSQGGGKGHLGLDHEPCCSENVEDCGGKDHGDDHCGIFTSAGFVSAKAVVEKACNEGHRNVSDDVAACNTQGDTDAACPAGEYGNTDAAEQNVDELAESAEFRAEEDPREEDCKGCQGNRYFSCQRHGERSQYTGNCGAKGAENEIVCCHFHAVSKPPNRIISMKS